MTARRGKKAGKTKKGVPASLRKVRKEVPPPTRVERSKKTYRRKAGRAWADEEVAEDVGC